MHVLSGLTSGQKMDGVFGSTCGWIDGGQMKYIRGLGGQMAGRLAKSVQLLPKAGNGWTDGWEVG